MKKSNILLSTIASFAILSSHSFAETTTLNEVEVTSTDVEVVSSSINLNQTSIETRQADHLSDLLRDIPGVDVGGSHSINNKLTLRGIRDENIDITIDGAKMPNVDIFHHMSNLRINPAILKKVKIQVGNNSVIHGDLGGAVEFETKDGKDMLQKGESFGGIVEANYNSNKSKGGSLTGFGKLSEKSDFLLYYKYQDNGNWKDGEGSRTFGVDGEIYNFLGKYNYDIDDSQSITFSYDRLQDKGDYVPRPNFGAEANRIISGNATYPTKFTRDTYTLNHELNLGEDLILDTSLYYGLHTIDRFEYIDGVTGVRPGGATSANIHGKVKNYGINTKAQSNIETGNILHTFTYGVEYDVQSSKVTNDGLKYGDDEKAKSLGIYVQNAIDFDNGLILTPGIRFNNYKLDGLNGDLDDNKFTYSLAADYAFNDNFSVFASATSLFKGVEMVEVLSTARTSYDYNPNIKSETGLNSEIGFKYIEDNILGADNIGFSTKYFKTTIKDYLDYDDIDGDTFDEAYNGGKLNIYGIESSFAYNLNNFSSLLTYTHTRSDFEDTGDSLTEEAGDKFSLNLKYKVNKELELSWKSIVVLDEDDPSSNLNVDRKEGYAVHDIAVKYEPKSVKGLKIIAGVDNIFDKTYTSHASVNQYFNHPRFGSGDANDYDPGRNFKVTLSYRF